MQRWTKVILVVVMVLVAGCTGVPKPSPAPVQLTDDERYRKYDELRNSTAGIPYVTSIGFDGRLDKLVVGVGTLEAKQAVQGEIIKLGLPEGAVVIVQPSQLLSEAAPFKDCQAAVRQPGGGDGRLIIPVVMTPGQEFDLTVKMDAKTDEITRGVDSYLECWDGKDWSPRFMLLVGYGSPDAKSTARVVGNNVVDSLGLMGPGPEKLVLPTNIPPGWYRIRKSVNVGGIQLTVTADFEVRSTGRP